MIMRLTGLSIDPLAEKYSYQSPYNFSENRVIDCRELEGLEAVKSTDGDVINVTVKVRPINNTVNTHAPLTEEQVNTAMANFISQSNKSYSGLNSKNQQVNVSVITDKDATLTMEFLPIVQDPEVAKQTGPDAEMSQLTLALAGGYVKPEDIGNTQTGNMQVSSYNNYPQPDDPKRVVKNVPGHTGSHELGHIFGLKHDNTPKPNGKLMRDGSNPNERTITPKERDIMLNNIPEAQ